MSKVIDGLKESKIKSSKMSKIGYKYTLSFIASLIFLIIMGTFAFFNQPIYIKFRLMTPELIIAITFFVLLIVSIVIQVIQLLKIEKKIYWFDFSVMFLAILSFFLNILAFIAVPLMVVAYVMQAASNKLKLKISIYSFLGFILLPFFAFVVLMSWGASAQLDTNETESFTIKSEAKDILANESSDKVYTAYSWNIGYGSTGSEMDYFYDKDVFGNSGSMGKAQNKAQVLDHLSGVTQFLDQISKEGGGIINSPDDVTRVDKNTDLISDQITLPKADFGLFQEVDRKSIRSMYTAQAEMLASHLNGYSAEFSRNMLGALFPVPFMDPGGQVEAGLLSFSHYEIDSANRVSLKSAGTGIDGIFNLKRAIGLTTYKLASGGTLYMGNLHMSAFPEDYIKRNKEFETLISALKEWTKDPENRVVIGGDWNTDITEQYYYKKAEEKAFNSKVKSVETAKDPVFGLPFSEVKGLDAFDIAKYPESYNEFIKSDTSWKIGVDSNLINPSMRLASSKWTSFDDSNTNQDVAIIDGFLVSDGVDILKTKTIQQGWHKNSSNPEHPFLFADSDHNPIMLQFKLK